MGVDLTLMPLYGKDYWCAHDMLNVNRRSSLWVRVVELEQQECPQPVTCFKAIHDRGLDSEHSGYGERDTDPYGGKLMWTTAGQLVTLKDDPDIADDWRNRAIWAYLGELPPDWQIVLFWH